MVDEVITKQELIDAQKDAQSLDDFIDGGDEQIVVTRLLKEYPTLANAIRQIYEKGGKFYPTLAAANADIANIRTDVYVITADNGAYYKATAGATSLTKSPYDPLTQAKADATTKANTAVANAKDYVDSNSSVKIANSVLTRINYDTVTRTLNFAGAIYVVKFKGRVDLKVPQTLTFATNGKYRLEFNPTTLDLRAIADSQASADGWAIAAYIEVSDTGMFTSDFLYAVNGVPYVPPQMGKITTSSTLNININTVSKMLESKGNGRIVANSVTVPTLAVNIPLPETNGIYKLVHNVHTSTLSLLSTSSSPKMGEIYIGNLTVSNGKYDLYGVDNYTIDGSVVNRELDQAKDYFKTNGTGVLIPANSAVINYDTATRVLSFTGTFYVVTNDTTVASLTTPQSFILDLNIPYRIECDPVTNTLFAVSYSASKTIGRIVLGWIRRPSETLSLEVSGFKVSVNGVEAQRSENGSLVTSNPVSINFDNTNKKLIISSNVRVKSPTFTMISSGVEVPYPSIGTYKLVFNKETNGFLFVVIASGVAETQSNRIELATVVFSTTAVRSVYGIDNYTIDGLAVSVGGGGSESLNGMLVASVPENINFDFVNSKLKITADQVRLNIDKATTLLPAVELNFLSIANQLWQKMIYNKSTKAFSAKQFSTTLDDNEIVFAYVHPLTEQVYGVADFYRNSKPTRYTKKLLPVIATYGDLRPKYIQPTLPEFNTILNSYGSDYTKIYQLYDALMAAHPEYITKRLIGSDALNNPIYSYQFTTPEVPTASKGSTKPKFIIFSGVHGGEKGGTYNTYSAMKQICERHEEDDHLHALKHGVNFIVVPVAVPTGFIQGSRKNHNGVDIARNFPTGWLPVSDPTSQTYSGTGPMSEKETQALVALMEEHKDALCFISHHNFTSTNHMVWVSARSNQMVNMSKMLILGETLKARKKYSWMPNDAYLGYTDLSGLPNGMEASHADALGMYGCTLEVGMITPWETDGTTYSSVFATLSCQFLINYMLVAIDSAAKTTLASISNP